MLKHYNIKVTGEVQGVWYRKSTQQKAAELEIKGFVKNQPDWSVYIEAEGNESQLKALLDWCAKGPEHATVEKVTWEEKELEFFKDFMIR